MTIYPTHKCFDDALDFIEALVKRRPELREDIVRNIRVVHAICLMPDNRPYAHAWIEDDKTNLCIFRGIIDNKTTDYLSATKEEYYEHFRVQEATRYTLLQAHYENVLSNSYGPWKDKYKALCRQPGEPHSYQKHELL